MWDTLTGPMNAAITDVFESVMVFGGVSVRGTFTDYKVDLDLTEVGISGSGPVFECTEDAAAAASIVVGSTGTYNGTSYRVVDADPDKQGWIVFNMEEL